MQLIGPLRIFLHCAEHFDEQSYDAIYLDLAIHRRLPLATLDDDLRKTAKKLGVSLLG
jgi:predicted nucleic acid-binding protein